MKCNLELLSEYYDGELSKEQRQKVEAHLAQCPECAAVLTEYQRVARAIRALPVQPVPPMLEESLESRLSELRDRTWWRRFLTPALELGAVAVAAMLAIIVIGGLLQESHVPAVSIRAAATPGTGDVGVPINTAIRVRFDRPVDRQSVEAAVTISPPLKVDFLWRGEDLFVVPKETLRPGTSYRVAIDTPVKDLEGRAVPMSFSTTFSTAEADEPNESVAAVTPVPSSVPQTVAEDKSRPTPPARLQAEIALQPEQTRAPIAAAAPVSSEPTSTPQPLVAPAETPAAELSPTPTSPDAAPTPPATPAGIMTMLGLAPTPDATAVTVADVGDDFRPVYEQNAEVRQRLGPPIAPEQGTLAAEQPFEGGHMFWRADLKRIYVIEFNGRWLSLDDTWSEDQPQSAGLKPPPGLYEPVRGFGKAWRENPNVRQALGWGVNNERGYIGAVQEFARGIMLWSDQGNIYALYSDGTWTRFANWPN